MKPWRWLALLLISGLVFSAARADDWPQWLGPQRDSVWRETGIMKTFPKEGPPVKWRMPISGGYAGPAVAEGRVFVLDYDAAGDRNADDGGTRTKLTGKERILCFDATTGKQLWKHEYDCKYDISYPIGPRCTPTVSGGKVYALGAMGDLTCLAAGDGKVLWTKNLPREYQAEVPQWGYSGHPLVDGKQLYCFAGGDGSTVVALDKDTGKELWRSLSAPIGYAPPVLVKAGGVQQLLIWHAEALNGLDPATGKVFWSIELKPDYGMSIMTPRKLGDYVFVGGVGGHGMLVKLAADKPAAEVAWRGKPNNAVYPVNSTPFLEDGYIYGVDQDSNLRCVKMEDGQRLWATLVPTVGAERDKSGTAFLVKNGDLFYLFNETGHLIIARLSPKGYDELARAKILEPTSKAFGRDVVWSHPAFANRCVYARNDKELVCVSLEAK
jgi:outer membrane protein assembly factor BamB